MTHYLKCAPEHFAPVNAGEKSFELRATDRLFMVGDHLLLREYMISCNAYTGRKCLVSVAHILHGPAYGLLAGYCIMSIRPLIPSIE